MSLPLDPIPLQILEFLCRHAPIDRAPPVFTRREDIAGMLRLSLNEYDAACGQLALQRLIVTDQPGSGDLDFIAPTKAGRRLGTPRPLPVTFWIEPGCLLAGEYPGALNPDEARGRLRQMLKVGITYFIDLTFEKGDPTSHSDKLEPYAPLLIEEAAQMQKRAEYRRMKIRDGSIPEPEYMKQILDAIDQAIAGGHVVYVHCWGGVGRTGTVLGCYLVRHGATGRGALAELKQMRSVLPTGERELRVPEMIEQDQFILNWQVGQ